jgi:hypothetical protein
MENIGGTSPTDYTNVYNGGTSADNFVTIYDAYSGNSNFNDSLGSRSNI